MPFSSVLGASSVIKPGVCTSATRPSVPFEGQLIYETDTDMVAAYNGSAWFYTHSSGLVLISSTTIGSAVSSVTVSSAFSSTYDNYFIAISGGVASGNVDLSLQLGATTTGYYAGYMKVVYSSASFVTSSNNNAANFSQIGVGTTNSLHAYVNVLSPNLAKHTNINGAFGVNLTGSASVVFSGFLNDSTQYTAFTIAPVQAGTLTGGTIKVYGYKN